MEFTNAGLTRVDVLCSAVLPSDLSSSWTLGRNFTASRWLSKAPGMQFRVLSVSIQCYGARKSFPLGSGHPYRGLLYFHLLLAIALQSMPCTSIHPIIPHLASPDTSSLLEPCSVCSSVSAAKFLKFLPLLQAGSRGTEVGSTRVFMIGNAQLFEQLTALDDSEHVLRWICVSHPQTISPFLRWV